MIVNQFFPDPPPFASHGARYPPNIASSRPNTCRAKRLPISRTGTPGSSCWPQGARTTWCTFGTSVLARRGSTPLFKVGKSEVFYGTSLRIAEWFGRRMALELGGRVAFSARLQRKMLRFVFFGWGGGGLNTCSPPQHCKHAWQMLRAPA